MTDDKTPDFGELKNVPVRQIWAHEAQDFTPWLEENIEVLGEAIGMDLEVIEREASVGGFSLDLLAKDLGAARNVIIENQFSETDHSHLGQLLTYAAGFDASAVIWVFESIRDEHRQALEWLNQRTDTETQFFAVEVEVLQIDNSKPVVNFKLIVFPNEWQKSKRQETSVSTSLKNEKYQTYYQQLIDELRDTHKFTSKRKPARGNWCYFTSTIKDIRYAVVFPQGGRTRVEIYIDQENSERNKAIFDALEGRKEEITAICESELEWQREVPNGQAARIAIYRDGDIEADEGKLEEIRRWHIETLLKFRDKLIPIIQKAVKSLD